MRNLNKNKQPMYYALQEKSIMTESGYYEDEEGNRYPLYEGEREYVYGTPVQFSANISMSGGESEADEFGLNKSDYNAVLVVEKGVLPITETSLIWFETEPTYDDNGYVDEHSADYSVVKISPSLNSVKYVLKKLVK